VACLQHQAAASPSSIAFAVRLNESVA